MTSNRVTVGFDVGGTKILAVVLDDQGRPTHRSARCATPQGGDAIIDAIEGLLAEVREPDDDVWAAGVGIPGMVDRTGTLRFGPHLAGVTDFPFAEALASRLGVLTTTDNDGTAAAFAENRVGAGQGVKDMVMITLGTGIGAGLVSNGELVRGANGFAGEPGHMMIHPNGPPCPCGQRGCWERFASGTGLGRMGRDAAVAGKADRVAELAGDPELVLGEHVTRAGREGDAQALAILSDFGWWLGVGIANLVNVTDPAKVVVGGGLIADAELVLPAARSAFHDQVMGVRWRPPVEIVAAELRERAGAIGAGLLARYDHM